MGVQKKALTKKPYPPGKQVQTRKSLSNYGKQFREKQKIKRMYNLSEKQFFNYYKKATHLKGITGEIMLQLLETRLDNVIYQSGLATSRYQSRQMVNHGHFFVNGKKVNIPSYVVEKGDVISIKPKMLKTPLFEQNKLKQAKPFVKWLEFVHSDAKILVLSLPVSSDFDPTMDIKTVVEFYSR